MHFIGHSFVTIYFCFVLRVRSAMCYTPFRVKVLALLNSKKNLLILCNRVRVDWSACIWSSVLYP